MAAKSTKLVKFNKKSTHVSKINICCQKSTNVAKSYKNQKILLKMKNVVKCCQNQKMLLKMKNVAKCCENQKMLLNVAKIKKCC